MAQTIRRLGLVAFDYLAASRLDAPLSMSDAERAMSVLDEHGCDTVLFALAWHGVRDVEPNWARLSALQSVVTSPDSGTMTLHQRSVAPRDLASIDLGSDHRDDATKALIVSVLPERTFRGAALLFGGEVNAFTMVRQANHFEAPEGWQEALHAGNVGLILNPSATYMRRWEMKRKRAFLSTGGRTVVSLWNRTTVGESQRAWTVFQDGVEITGAVRALNALDDRLSLAILDLPGVEPTS